MQIADHDPYLPKLQQWDWKYLDLASFISRWSKDQSGVGAIIVNNTLGRIIAVGFNGFPTNITDCVILLKNKPRKREMIIHAEQNALLFAGRDARDCHLFVVGKPICNTCAILAIQSGIKRVVAITPAPKPASGRSGEWDRRGRLACKLLDEAGVEFVSHSKVGWVAPDILSHDPDLMRPNLRSVSKGGMQYEVMAQTA
jgi:dCMP deaminase